MEIKMVQHNDERHEKFSPVRAKPEFYRKALYSALTKSHGLNDAVQRMERILDQLEEAQRDFLKREMNEHERREFCLRAYTDIRNSLLALGLEVGASQRDTDTTFRRTRNLNLLRWEAEKRLLMHHWSITRDELDDRQVESGMRMPQFLQESLKNEGLS